MVVGISILQTKASSLTARNPMCYVIHSKDPTLEIRMFDGWPS